MSKTTKLVALMLVSFIATGSVIYNLSNRRRRPVTQVNVPAQNTPSTPESAAPAPPPQAIAAPEADSNRSRPSIPPSGWDRNPFLTIDEINRLNSPQPETVVQTPTQRTVEPAALPVYALTGIFSGSMGLSAIVDSRVVRTGDRLGSETVKEIKEGAVVLESPGQTRQLTLKRMEDTEVASPKKETKQ